jgi:hypothetical protein
MRGQDEGKKHQQRDEQMKQSDENRAQRLLQLRKEKAAFRWTYFTRSRRFWMGSVAAILLTSYTVTGERGYAVNRLIWLLAGVFLGRLVRDYIWLKDVVDAGPFLEKVLDWDKVEKLASRAESRSANA